MRVYCATTNPGKLAEFRAAASSRLRIDALPGLAGIPPCDETGSTFEENAAQKALYYSTFTTEYMFVDDSGLSVDALGGDPGVHSARFAGPSASDERTGRAARVRCARVSDEANNRLLLEKMEGLNDRRARFVCVIALARAGRIAGSFRGEVEGAILHEPRGNQGFGYDPLFFHPGFGCTFGEVNREKKQTVSHRGIALRKLIHFLETEG
ncbi:MAG: RdgB/HAM1 family non-canonical purine NTP pyrophosphatase [Bryobacteraceae bacterium]